MSLPISLSIVSHAQWELVHELLKDIALHCSNCELEIILTLNLPESIQFDQEKYPFKVQIIKNSYPLGFGANHNQAFKKASGSYFCVMNPDIRLKENPFNSLILCLDNPKMGVVAPKVLNNLGQSEDNGRSFPSPFKIICKVIRGCKFSKYKQVGNFIYPDWIGGMFMLFPTKVFNLLNGFDERYFLYYEDVDICARLQLKGYIPAISTKLSVIHNARRESHRNFKYLRWHIASMLRFFLSYPYLRIVLSRLLVLKK